jgi:hypothetical protein
LETHATHAGVDGRDKPGHDGTGAFSRSNFVTWAYPSAYGSTTAASPGAARQFAQLTINLLNSLRFKTWRRKLAFTMPQSNCGGFNPS